MKQLPVFEPMSCGLQMSSATRRSQSIIGQVIHAPHVSVAGIDVQIFIGPVGAADLSLDTHPGQSRSRMAKLNSLTIPCALI